MIRAVLYLSLVTLFCSGCGNNHTKIDTFLKNQSAAPVPFVKALFEVTIKDSNENNQLTAVALCVPDSKYRIEFYGPLGIHVGSFLWLSDKWELYSPEDNILYIGTGSKIETPELQGINIHYLVGAFWNNLLPQGWMHAQHNESGNNEILEWSDSRQKFKAAINQKNGEVTTVSIFKNNDETTIDYSDYQPIPPYTIPTTILHTFSNQRSLSLQLNDLFYDRTEKQKYWNLKTPSSVEKIYVR